MEKGLRAPEDPEASRIRLMVPGELPPLPGSGGNADMRPGQWDSHEEGPPGDWRLLVPSQVHGMVPHGSKNPAYTSDVCVQGTGMWTWFLSPFFSSLRSSLFCSSKCGSRAAALPGSLWKHRFPAHPDLPG